MFIAAHSKLLCASLHAAPHHQPISRLEDVQRAGHSGVGHRTNEYRNVLSKTTNKEAEERQEKTKKMETGENYKKK